MASYKYLSSRKSHVTYNSVNVVDLVNRAKLEKNKEKKNEADRKYYEDNKEKIKEVNRKYRQKNKEKVLLQSKKWKQENKEKINEHQKERYYTDPCYKLRQIVGNSINTALKGGKGGMLKGAKSDKEVEFKESKPKDEGRRKPVKMENLRGEKAGWKMVEGSNFWSVDEKDPYWQTKEGHKEAMDLYGTKPSWVKEPSLEYNPKTGEYDPIEKEEFVDLKPTKRISL